MEQTVFRQKISMILDPYYDREFFTNLIYCMDRDKSIRDVFEAALLELNVSPQWSDDLDRSLLYCYYAYQASSAMREHYQWLPLANAFYGLALHRGDGQRAIRPISSDDIVPQACTPEDFKQLIRKEVRRVEPKERAWASLVFLLENRTSRSKALNGLLSEALESVSAEHFGLFVKALEVSMAAGWRRSDIFLRRPFEQFWTARPASESVSRALKVASATPYSGGSLPVAWLPEWTEELWTRLTSQAVDSVWTFINQLGSKGATSDQIFTLLNVLRGRCFYLMDSSQWPLCASSLMFSDALTGAAKLDPSSLSKYLAVNVFDLTALVGLIPQTIAERPTGRDILEEASQTVSKDRLVLRLDDCVERGARRDSLELLAALLSDQGLSRTLADRLLLMAAKQDSWTFLSRVLPVGLVLTQTYQDLSRLHMSGGLHGDCLLGLVRFLSDVRELSLQIVAKTGTYGDHLPLSQFDVSGGARIVDRFVFNQMRNAQRVKVWPSNN